jgi:hypothetical protein
MDERRLAARVRDLLDWVLGDRPDAPLTGRVIGLPATYDLTCEESAASEVAAQRSPGGPPVNPTAYPPSQHAEAMLASVAWVRGESFVSPVDARGNGPYAHGHFSAASLSK